MPTGPPASPPHTMPNTAEVIASTSAPGRPAFVNSGAKASPVAGPPINVTEPAITPISGFSPSAVATPIPSTFCATHTTVAKVRKITTAAPPERSNATLAPMPMVVKNATSSSGCPVVSSCRFRKRSRQTKTTAANTRPPTTAEGMLSRFSSAIRCRSSTPA